MRNKPQTPGERLVMRMLDKHYCRKPGTLKLQDFRSENREYTGPDRVADDMRTLARNIDRLIARADAKKASKKVRKKNVL